MPTTAEHDMAKPNHDNSYPVVAKSYSADATNQAATPETEPENRPIVLTAREWEAFFAAWEGVYRPRPKLEALVRRYRDCQLSDVG